MGNSKPVWLLDVDGVINACPWDKQFPSTFPMDTWELRKIESKSTEQFWPICWSTEVIDFINRMSERVEIRWHTTWQFDALHLAEELGLNKFDVVDGSNYFTRKMSGYIQLTSYNWWKMQAGVDVVNLEKRPLIWTDDDLTFEWQRVLVTDKTHDEDVPTCLVKPYVETGLTRKDLETIEQFISENEGG